MVSYQNKFYVYHSLGISNNQINMWDNWVIVSLSRQKRIGELVWLQWGCFNETENVSLWYISNLIALYMSPFFDYLLFWIHLIIFEYNSHEQAKEATLMRPSSDSKPRQHQQQEDPRLPRQRISQQVFRPQPDSSLWMSSAIFGRRPRRTTKTMQSSSQRMIWIESKMQQL